MSNGNSVTLVGNVTRDPELRFTPNGQADGVLRPCREQALAESPDAGMGGGDLFLRRRLLAEMAENVSETLLRGGAELRHGPARAAQLGDRGGRQAVEGGECG